LTFRRLGWAYLGNSAWKTNFRRMVSLIGVAMVSLIGVAIA